VGHITPDSGPPEVHDGRQGWQLLAHLGHGGVTDRPRMGLGQLFDGRHWRLQVAGHFGGGLGSRVCNAERVQREREGRQEAPIAVVRLFPSTHLGLSRRHHPRGLWRSLIRLGLLLASGARLLRVLECLMRLSPMAPKGE